MEIMLKIFFGIIFFSFILLWRINERNKQFLKTMKVGDYCKIYYQWKTNEHEVRSSCRIVEINGDDISVEVNDEIIKVKRNKIYV